MRPLVALVALLLSLLTTVPAGAAGLPPAEPEEVGLSPDRLARITEALKADVERGRIPGAVVVVARRGRAAYAEAVGLRDKAAGAPMPADAIVFSVPPATQGRLAQALATDPDTGKPVSLSIPGSSWSSSRCCRRS